MTLEEFGKVMTHENRRIARKAVEDALGITDEDADTLADLCLRHESLMRAVYWAKDNEVMENLPYRPA